MKKLPEKGIFYKTSRISYISNYVLVILAVLLLSILWPNFNLTFTLTPKNINELLPTVFVFAFIVLIIFLVEEPSIERLIRQYVVTNHEVVKIEGLLTKKKTTIPYQSVANIKIHKSILGRLLNYGTLHVTCVGREGNDIVMKGIRNPDEVYSILQNKIGLMRKTIVHKKRIERENLGEFSEEEVKGTEELERQFREENR